ncbi:hypothetical protein [Paucibacter soli]|uniref:hypothetical protein n=1 Tax=Paucibacter soli TaxID=3133433 RepID=UPI0030B478DA
MAEVGFLERLLRAEAELGLVGARFILAAGRGYGAHASSDDFPRGIPQACYANAFRLSQEDERLTYVEGVALSLGIVPIEHAWCVNREGLIVDNTWDGREQQYYGVAFDSAWMAGRVLSQGRFGIMPELFPRDLLDLDPSTFLAMPTPSQALAVRSLFAVVLDEIRQRSRSNQRADRKGG